MNIEKYKAKAEALREIYEELPYQCMVMHSHDFYSKLSWITTDIMRLEENAFPEDDNPKRAERRINNTYNRMVKNITSLGLYVEEWSKETVILWSRSDRRVVKKVYETEDTITYLDMSNKREGIREFDKRDVMTGKYIEMEDRYNDEIEGRSSI